MCAGERERSVVVIEHRTRPRGGGVAGLAGRREARGCMIWISRSVPICLVASVAVGRQRGVVVVHMTG